MKIATFFSNIKKQYKEDKWYTIAEVVLYFLLVVIFLTMFYDDNFGIFRTSFWNLNNAFLGQPEWLFTSVNTAYGLGHQLLCEIWTLPMVILYRIFGDCIVNSLLAVLWYKSIVLIFLFLLIKEMKKLMTLLNIKDDKKIILYFLSSILVALPIFHVAQTDVVYLFLMIWGMNEYFGGRRSKAMVIYAFAFPMKYLSLLVVIPLVLITEKRLLQIIKNLAITFVVFPLEKIIRYFANKAVLLNSYGVDSGHTASSIQQAQANTSVVDPMASHFINKILYFELPAVRKGITIYTLVFLFVLLCVWCYVQKKDNEEENRRKALYASSVSLLLFFMLASPSPYWIVVQYPFIIIMMFMNGDRIRLNVLLENVYTFSMFFVFVIDTFWVFGGSCTFDWLIFDRLGITEYCGTLQEGVNIAGYLNKFGGEKLITLVASVNLACAVAMVAVNYPNFKYSDELKNDEEYKVKKYSIVFRIALLGIWVLMNMILIGRIFIGG